MWQSFTVIGRGISEITRWKKKKHHEHFIRPPVTTVHGRPNKEYKHTTQTKLLKPRIAVHCNNVHASVYPWYKLQSSATSATQLSKQWRRNEINIAGARRGPRGRNSKPEKQTQGPGFLDRGLPTLPHQLRGLRECCELRSPVGSSAKPWPASIFGCILGSSGELSCRPGRQNCV